MSVCKYGQPVAMKKKMLLRSDNNGGNKKHVKPYESWYMHCDKLF